MCLDLTVQQRTQRCRCGRYLAWWTRTTATCCMRTPENCTWEPTTDPAEGCHGIDFEHVREPEGEDPECE